MCFSGACEVSDGRRCCCCHGHELAMAEDRETSRAGPMKPIDVVGAAIDAGQALFRCGRFGRADAPDVKRSWAEVPAFTAEVEQRPPRFQVKAKIERKRACILRTERESSATVPAPEMLKERATDSAALERWVDEQVGEDAGGSEGCDGAEADDEASFVSRDVDPPACRKVCDIGSVGGGIGRRLAAGECDRC